MGPVIWVGYPRGPYSTVPHLWQTNTHFGKSAGGAWGWMVGSWNGMEWKANCFWYHDSTSTWVVVYIIYMYIASFSISMVMVSTSISVLTWNNHIASEHLQDFLRVSFFPQEHGRFLHIIKPSERKTEQTIPLPTNDSRGGGFDGYFAGSFGGVFFHPSTWWHVFCWWINIGFTYLQECGGLEIAINHRNYTVIDFSEIEWGFFHTIFFFGGVMDTWNCSVEEFFQFGDMVKVFYEIFVDMIFVTCSDMTAS